MKERTEVLIIGAGPTGLTLAIELQRHGVDFCIIDKNDGPVKTSNALAIQSRTLEILSEMGVLGEVMERGQKLTGMTMFAENDLITHIDFQRMKSPYPFAIGLPQRETEQILDEKLKELQGEIYRKTELIDFQQNEAGITAHVLTEDGETRTIYAHWMVACDGSHSKIRKSLELNFDGETMKQHFILADMKIDWKHQHDEIYSFLSEDGPMAIFCLPNGYSRVVAEVTNDPKLHDSIHPNEEDFEEITKKRSPIPMDLHDTIWTSGFTINSRMTEKYRVGNIFLCGDAAHVHSPVGGQGMNTGMQDAYNLAWKLALVSKGVGQETLLDSYEVERKPVAKNILKESSAMTKLVTLKNKFLKMIRNWILKHITQNEKVQDGFVKRIGEMDVNYSMSPIVDRGGEYAVDFLTEIDDISHHLFIYTDNPQEVKEIEETIRNRYGDSLQLHVKPAKDKRGVYLIRPDQYIGYKSDAINLESIESYLKNVFKS